MTQFAFVWWWHHIIDSCQLGDAHPIKNNDDAMPQSAFVWWWRPNDPICIGDDVIMSDSCQFGIAHLQLWRDDDVGDDLFSEWGYHEVSADTTW